ncbi:hypothetical protein TIFTF001_027904 [Ficus carica]|uniref:Zinc finger LSD1-type domain-containing protein n=1 Tax=Ficus carica TaxID=3494 RepID=A0AA88J0W7_FICCA|nr:hypothetical protein TIFTF001_027904 [Ficus carica]
MVGRIGIVRKQTDLRESISSGMLALNIQLLSGMEMAQLICGGCRTLLMYTRGATSVRCSCCHTVNLAPGSNQVAHVNCGNCRTTLMYPYGAPSVKCAVCQYVTNVGGNMRVPIPVNRPNGIHSTMPSTSAPMPHSQSQTVVVENPMSVDESGKLTRGEKDIPAVIGVDCYINIVSQHIEF